MDEISQGKKKKNLNKKHATTREEKNQQLLPWSSHFRHEEFNVKVVRRQAGRAVLLHAPELFIQHETQNGKRRERMRKKTTVMMVPARISPLPQSASSSDSSSSAVSSQVSHWFTWNRAFPFPGNSWVMSSFHARKASSSMISMS